MVLSEDSLDERSDDGELPSIRVSRRARAPRQRQDDGTWIYH